MNRFAILLCSTACALAIGCGESAPTLVPVTGKVVLRDQPVTAGSITFHPASTADYTEDNPSSLLQLDGAFTMKTFPFGEGVAPGPYRVTLAPELATRLGHPEYADPAETPWEVTVTDAGVTDLVFRVE